MVAVVTRSKRLLVQLTCDTTNMLTGGYDDRPKGPMSRPGKPTPTIHQDHALMAVQGAQIVVRSVVMAFATQGVPSMKWACTISRCNPEN